MMPEAVAELGGLDVRVNNTGISDPTSSVAGFDPEAWDKVMQINLTGTFYVTCLAIPGLMQSKAPRSSSCPPWSGVTAISQPQRLFDQQVGP